MPSERFPGFGEILPQAPLRHDHENWIGMLDGGIVKAIGGIDSPFAGRNCRGIEYTILACRLTKRAL